jgi:hypothetical protein
MGRAADLGGGGELRRWGGWRTFAVAGRVGALAAMESGGDGPGEGGDGEGC